MEEGQFGAGSRKFSLSSKGEELLLLSAGVDGFPTGYLDRRKFGASDPGQVFGVYHRAANGSDFTFLQWPTPGGANWGFRRESVVISEIMFRPPDIVVGTNAYSNTEDEFIELANLSTQRVDLTTGTNRWVLRGGVSFEFPPGSFLNATSTAVVVSFSPTNAAELARFRSTYTLGTSVRYYGPFQGSLKNSGERLALARRGESGWIELDAVEYETTAPWPSGANGSGHSLQRRNLLEFANDPLNWASAASTPGKPYAPSAVLQWKVEPASQTAALGEPVQWNASASGNELKYQWRKQRVALPGATNATLSLASVTSADAGIYDLVVQNETGSLSSREFELVVLSAPKDTDADGMPDEWENRYSFLPMDPTDALTDFDGDGATNLEEFLSGTDPHLPGSALKIHRIEVRATEVLVSFQGVAGKTYLMESSDAFNAPWDILQEVHPALDGMQDLNLARPENRRFYRVRLAP